MTDDDQVFLPYGLTAEQVATLLRPIHPSRVLHANGQSHVSQQDVRAHLTRVFGFGGWSSEVLSLDLVREAHGTNRDGSDKNGWDVTYRAVVRLIIRDPRGNKLASYDDAGTGTSPNLPALGDAHDFACKVAVSMALKRCAINLGDGFGLSLYNKGQTAPLVIGTLVMPGGTGEDASQAVPEQVSLGNDDTGSAEPDERPAERGAVPPEQDQWQTPEPTPGEPGTDRVWLNDWLARGLEAKTADELGTLWVELVEVRAQGDITNDDAASARDYLAERKAALEQLAAQAAAVTRQDELAGVTS